MLKVIEVALGGAGAYLLACVVDGFRRGVVLGLVDGLGAMALEKRRRQAAALLLEKLQDQRRGR